MQSDIHGRKAVLAKTKSGELAVDEALRLLKLSAGAPASNEPAAEPAAEPADEEPLLRRLEAWLAGVLAAEARIPLADVRPAEPLDRYGFDSVMALNVVRALETDFGSLSPTLLFEHRTVAALAGYLALEHRPAVERLLPGVPGAVGAVGAAQGRSAGPVPRVPAAPVPRADAAGAPAVPAGGEIAVVGLSGRFPLADDLDEFWANLEAGRDCITEIPADRWDHSRLFDPEPGKPGRSYTKWGGFLRDMDAFDAEFFRISPREAERMDPQERLFLQEAWHALEDGGLTKSQVAGCRAGVYVGVMYAQYQLLQAEQGVLGNPLHLGSSYASIANRVSHFLDLRGPSMAVDTMCSSSLTALHLACEALRRGDIEMALAGGVNLNLHPNKYLDLSQGRYASTDGRCRSFGEGGDGYVPGEGVGVAVLKPLAAAVAAGDRIHAVIRGTALGHGGRTNGYSVPNPTEQTRLIAEAYRRAGVDPKAVTYIEAHGTGTSLGDPIEIAALDRALGEPAPGAGPRSIGSVKSGIGHLEGAAGIAGLAKVVLQLKNRRLVPSLHAERLNPHIDFDATGLRVQRTLEEWTSEGGPRAAGLSSFGAGGANAHVIIEEYVPAAQAPATGPDAGPELILLCAQNEERLRVWAGMLAYHLSRRDTTGRARLADVAHTLRTGREPLDERLALVVESIDELTARLRQFASTGEAEGVVRGNVLRDGPPAVAAAPAGRAPEDLRPAELGRLWVQGAELGRSAARPVPARQVGLPGYPFLRERHWPELVEAGAPGRPGPHPLLGANASTFDRQRFVTSLDPSSPWLRDHRISGRAVLPAAALLEMVLAAGRLSGLGDRLRIEDSVWEAPVDPVAPYELTVELVREDGHISYTVTGTTDGGDRRGHAHGRLAVADGPAAAPLDLAALRARCGETLDGETCYRIFAERGLGYGGAMRALDHVATGDDFALGRVRLGVGGDRTSGYLLHPALLDAAFQTLLGFDREGPASGAPRVPFAVDRVEATDALPEQGWVLARARGTARDESGRPQVFDLSLADDEGRVLAEITGLLVRPAVAPAAHRTVLLRHEWRRTEPPAAGRAPGGILLLESGPAVGDALEARGLTVVRVRPGERFTDLGDGRYRIDPRDDAQYERLLDAVLSGPAAVDTVVHAWAPNPSDADAALSQEQLDLGFHSLLALFRAWVGRSSATGLRLVHAHAPGAVAPGALAAFGRALAAEHPACSHTSVELPVGPGGQPVDVALLMAELEADLPGVTEVRHLDGVRYVRTLAEFAPQRSGATGLREHGVYLVTGALGGLGRVLAGHLARRWKARLVLSGRSALDERGEAFLAGLREAGAEAVYLAADCATEEGARRLVGEARTRYGRLDGVVHLAGTLRDGLVLRKRRADAEAVLRPKIWGAHHLDRATAAEPLDFFALFSSASSVTGVAGQADYAYANAFLDGFAAWREDRRRAGQRSGATVSVAWPLWEAGGMDVDDSAKRWIEEHLGWVPLPVETGLELFEETLRGRDTRLAVFHGHRPRILGSLALSDDGPRPAAPPAAPTAPAAEPSADSSPPIETREVEPRPDLAPAAQALLSHLTRTVAAELKLPAERLDPRTRFERLGLESVMVMNLTRDLETVFGALPKTLFFEYQCLADLCAHLVETHPDAVAARFGSAPQTSPKTAPAAPAQAAPVPAAVRTAGGGERHDEPIAVVGLGGRYPMADTLDEFWANLRQGRDCITEIPASRWDHSRYFDPAADTPGKSYSKWGGFLRDVDRFDPLFFNISPREAKLMDPQERLFLETAWHTLEDAGHSRASLAGRRVGVFVGVMYAQYQLYGAHPAMQARGFIPSSLSASVANRVSYTLDLTGPSLALDTMCSSSLTALHLACASIRLGDCDEAIAGGVNAILHPNRYLQISQAKFASTDGRCRSFGDGGDGYVPGEGVGAVLLKPLSRAEADGDHIYAVIRGSAVNHGGRSNGYTVPSPVAQSDVIGRALRTAGVDPADLDYIEAHGTGTSLGDPIEVAGLVKAFAHAGSPRTSDCPIGSVKSNIGHLESAAGIAGLTKILLQFRHAELAPSLHAERLNANVVFEGSGLRVQRTLEPWPARTADGRERPRIAAVSSFGAGGTNAHVIVEQYQPREVAVAAEERPELITLSARTEAQLMRLAADLAERVGPAGAPASEEVLTGLRTLAGDVLGVAGPEISPDEDLENLGFDAAALAELANRLQYAHEVDITPATLAEVRTLRALAGQVSAAAVAPSTYRLGDIAFTLRAGREPQEERLALVASDVSELALMLRRFCAGEEVPGLFRGRAASAEAGPWSSLLDGDEGEAFLAAVQRSGDLGKLARLWASGLDSAASAPAPVVGARRVSLPTYPFARDRYWLPEDMDTGLPTGPVPAETPAPAPITPAASAPPAPTPSAGPAVAPAPLARPAHPAPLPATVPAVPITAVAPAPAPWEQVRKVIVESMAAVLEIPAEEFGPDVPHSDFGVDSVLAVEIVDRINRDLGAELKPTDFFSYSTLRGLTDHVTRAGGLRLPAEPVAEPVPTAPTAPAVQPAPAAHPAPATAAPAAPAVVAPGDVAVIGMSGRFPDAADLDQLWANLAAGRDSVREIPAERWDVNHHWDPDPQAPGKTYGKWGSVLADIDRFDPDFFGMSPREARLMDPQQRLYLMEAWRALEDAGYSDRMLDGTECHAFVGTAMGDYHHLLRESGVPVEGYTFMGTHPAVLSSRLSYHLNLRGPSLAVDTSCSSSLMAVHLACEAIRAGRCELAVAGGVAALSTPELHILASKAGMLSPTGRCRSFDDCADGFVPGEGVGVLVLKSLERALADGDHIHGVIAASGANQDGRSNGITAPSMPAQQQLEQAVYGRFGIDPDRIGYVECHGTGTRLGDPIEIEALTTTFRDATARTGYCAIGSIKSNLGHTLTAAGVAGVIKTLLSLKHGQLPPSLHFDTPNRYIPFADSPFYVNTELTAWPQPLDGGPRHAAVSSFGFSGTNVHAVVREAPALPVRPAELPGRWRLCPVSAKSERALDERLGALYDWLAAESTRHEWRDIAHTLGAGRSHFTVRAVFVARSAQELRELIAEYRRSGRGPGAGTGPLVPQQATFAPSRRPARTLAAPAESPSTSSTRTSGRHAESTHRTPLLDGQTLPAGALADLAERYLEGEELDWDSLRDGEPCRRIPMPTYPFARERYWVPGTTDAPARTAPPAAPLAPAARPAPREGEEHVFRHRLAVDQPLIRDHVVDGRPLLPAAGHLSLVHHDLRELAGDGPVTLTRAVWLRPLFVEADREIEIGIRSEGAGRYSFQVRGTEPGGATTVFSSGTARTGAGPDRRVDLAAVRATCPDRLTAEGHYALFTRMDIRYGPHFRTVREIHRGGTEALAALVHDGAGPDIPAGILDGAVQTVAALQPDSGGRQRPQVPFAMDEIHVLRPVPAECFAHVRQTREGECSVSIVDAEGRPCIVIEGFSYRELKEPVRTRLYVPRWSELDCPAPTPADGTAPVLVIAPPQDHGLAARIAERHRGARVDVLRLDPAAGPSALAAGLAGLPQPQKVYFLGGLPQDPGADLLDLAAAERSQELGLRSLFRLVKALLSGGAGERATALTSVTADGHALTPGEQPRPSAAALFGFTRSLAKEQPSWQVGCLDLGLRELAEDGEAVAEAVVAEPGHPEGHETVLRQGRRWTRVLAAAEPADPAGTPLRHGGTYLILGGAGGIGAELALHLARRAAARVVLVGRRPHSAAIDEQLRAIEAAGGRGLYVRADGTDDAAMTAAVATAKQRFGAIHGAFHSALVLRDGRIDGLDEAAFEAALTPKVRGALVLARALRTESLDFLVFFSSANSFSGNLGQSNYAAGCTFKDAFATALAATGVPARIVNWGYWGEVGIVAKAGYRRRMEALGVHSIGVAEGMAALETVLAHRIPQAMALKAEQRVLGRFGVVDEAGDGTPGERLLRAHAGLNALGASLAARSLQELGAFRAAGEERSAARLAADLAIVPRHHELFGTLLGIVAGAGYLAREGDRLLATRAVEELPRRDLAAEAKQLTAEHPEVAAHTDLLTACLAEYPQLLRGETDPTEVMFPGSSMERVERIYRGDPLSDRLNQQAAQAVGDHLAGRPPGARIRVLEVGAGTGGTTERVLAAVAPYGAHVEYVYTDLSAAFLRHGRRRFGAQHPYVTFARLDIEQNPLDQGFRQGSFDLVVAANVLHATKDLRRTLAHVALLLGEHGRLVLSETTGFTPFTTLTFGLLEGWWLREDGALRIPGSPLADVPTWQRLLAEAGLGTTAVHSPVEGSADGLGQHVLVADRRPRAAAAEHPPVAATGGAPAGPDRAAVRDLLAASIAETLGRDDAELDPDRPFIDFGVSSIILVELVNTLNARLGTDLRTTALFDHPTLAELTEHVCDDHAPALAGAARTPVAARDDENDDTDTDPEAALLERLAAGELTADQIYARLERVSE